MGWLGYELICILDQPVTPGNRLHAKPVHS